MDREALITDNMALVTYMLKKITGSYDEDLYQSGCLGLTKAAQSFDPEKGFKFTTYASRCIMNEIFMEFRSNKKRFLCVSLDAEFSKHNDLTLSKLLPNKSESVESLVLSEIHINDAMGKLSK